MIKNIVFDLGGVLIDWNPRYVFKHYFETSEAMEYFLKEICSSEWNEEQDGGRTLAAGTQIAIDEFPEYETEIRAYYGRWEEMLGGAMEGSVNILKQVVEDKSYRVLALTNWSGETFPIAKRRFDFLSWFESILVSGDEGIKKPDPNIFRLMVQRNNILAEESLFIDDNIKNIKAARELGFETIHFTSPENTRTQLINLNILNAE